jgi:hypothetical protein
MERVNYKYAALFSYMVEHGVQCRRVGGRLDSPSHDPAIMAYLYPNSGGFEGRGMAVDRCVFGRARGSC